MRKRRCGCLTCPVCRPRVLRRREKFVDEVRAEGHVAQIRAVRDMESSPRHPGTIIDLTQLSYAAVAGVMNGLNCHTWNPPAMDFEHAADRRAFSAASLEVANRWWAKRQGDRP